MSAKQLTPWWVTEGLGKYAMTDERLAPYAPAWRSWRKKSLNNRRK